MSSVLLNIMIHRAHTILACVRRIILRLLGRSISTPVRLLILLITVASVLRHTVLLRYHDMNYFIDRER